MSKFYLEEPSLARKDDVIAYLQEFKQYNSTPNGSSVFENILYGKTYEECLEQMNKLSNENYALSLNRLPSKTFFFIRQDDNKLIGMLNIRLNIPLIKSPFSGHVGYSIRPSEQRKGYNKINLYLGLKEALKLGLTNIRISCESSNIGSNKTILSLGGKLYLKDLDPEDNTETNVYKIDVPSSLAQYRDTYEPNIYNS